MCVSKFYLALLVMLAVSFNFSVLSDIEEQRRFVWTYLSSSGNCKAIREQKIAYSFCTNRALNFMTCLLALHGCIVRILCP